MRRRLAAAALGLALAGGAAAGTPPAGSAAAGPSISARSALLVEGSTDTPVYGRAAAHRRPIASTTKLMTALLTLRHARLSQIFTAPGATAGAGESQIGLRAGERMRVADLLRALLLPSANDAAATLAVGVGGSRARFVRMMNREARRLGLRHTHYTTPVGLDDPGNYSDAFDLARLAILLRRNAFFRRTVDEPRALLRSGSHRRLVVNRNALVRSVPWVNGVKTGHTRGAGYVLVASATRRGLNFVSVVLGTPSESARDADSLAVLRYGFAHFRLARPLRRGQVLLRVRVRDHAGLRIPLLAARGVTRVERRGPVDRLDASAPRELRGPLRARAVVGSVTVLAGRRVVARVPLLTARRVPGPSTLHAIGRFVVRPSTLLGVVVLAGAAAAAIAGRRRRRRRERRRQRRRADIEPA